MASAPALRLTTKTLPMQKPRNYKLLAFSLQLLAGGVFLLPLDAHAQTVPDPVQYIVASETPGPQELVIIEAQGVGSFLGNATLTWSQDGKVAEQGVGKRVFKFTTGPLGSNTRIRVSIQSDTAGSFSKDFSFTPALVNLVWEADTSVPPFYRGKALYSAGSPLKIVAFPTVFNGASQVAPQALSYQWYRAGDLVPESSGLGRNTFSIDGDQLHAQEAIAVDLYYGSRKAARGELLVPAVEPGIILYHRDALRGTRWEQALPAGGIQLQASEMTVQAEPFFFSNSSKKAGRISYLWTLNGEEISGPDSTRGLLTLRQSGTGAGSAMLEVKAQNNDTNAFIQQAAVALQIVFGQQEQSIFSSFFGL